MRHRSFLGTLTLLGLMLGSALHAQIPREITYQGLLTDANGNPVPDGFVTVSLALYDAATGGTALYQETQNVQVRRGVFDMILGKVSPIPATILFDRTYYVGVRINNGVEMQPRTQLTSAPYAIRAGVASSLAPNATGVVRSINGQEGAVTLQGGGSTTVTQVGSTITISSAGGGGTGIAGIQNSDGAISITNPNGPVATIGLNDESISTAKIADGAVTADKIASGVIPTTLAPSGAAGGDLSGTYPNPTIATNAITTDKILDGAVTLPKLTTTGATSGQAIIYNGTGVAWGAPAMNLTFPITATTSTNSTAFWLTTTGTGRAAQFTVNNAASTTEALRVESNAGTVLIAHGTGVGQAGYFRLNNAANAAASVYAETNGTGNALHGFTSGSGAGIFATNSSTGRAAHFTISSLTNSSEALRVNTNGTGRAGYFTIGSSGSNSSALVGEISGGGGWSGPAGVHGRSTGNGGIGVYGEATGSSASGIPARGIYGHAASGRGVQGYSSSNYAVMGEVDGTGTGVFGYNSGTGRAGHFQINNASSAANALYVETNSNGIALRVNQVGNVGDLASFQVAGGNVARIDRTGRGFFNGGTQIGGADVAEAFEVEGSVTAYEPGDVLVISTTTDRTLEKSDEAYSTRVVGVFATKPGVILTERNVEQNHDDMVPLGVVGVIPTKVTAENGPIRRGDLIVTSSTPGHAMRADEAKIRFGSVIGKALEDFDGDGTGLINVLVNVK